MPSPTTSNTPAASLSPPPPLSAPSQWGPYSSAKNFDANMANVFVALVCAAAAAFALRAACTLLVRRLRRRVSSPPSSEASGKPCSEALPPPPHLPAPVVFSSGATVVAGAPECSICLAELVEGDRVRVLPSCGHGFHARCVDAWLVAGCRSSCPTCRADYRTPPPPPPPPVTEP